MYVCSHCHTAIVDRSRAYRGPDGFWLDRGCARQLACEGQLREVDAPLVDARHRIAEYRRLRWSEAVDSFVTIPGS